MAALLLSLCAAACGAEAQRVFRSESGTEWNLGTPSRPAVVGSQFFFRGAADPAYGMELWRSDGTAGGTRLVRDIAPGHASSDPQHLTALGNLLIFSVFSAEARGLWRSDGTPEGTFPLFDGVAVLRQNNYGGPMTVMGGKAYFFGSADRPRLWATDGTPEGTAPVMGFPEGGGLPDPLSDIGVDGGTIYFSCSQPYTGLELWRSDGTAEGTRMVKDLYPGYENWYHSGNPRHFTPFLGQMYFIAYSAEGEGLWKTDGTEEGTVRVKSLPYLGRGGLTRAGNHLFFHADGGDGVELWRSDGTSEGTAQLRDIYPGVDGYGQKHSSFPSNMLEMGGLLYFLAKDAQAAKIAYTMQLWRSDGTPEGTVKALDTLINEDMGNRDSPGFNLQIMGGSLYFASANSTPWYQLWKSDGTPAGTVSADGGPDGPPEASPLVFFNEKVYLAGRNSLWSTTNGTMNGGQLVRMLAPQYTWLSLNLAGAGNNLYFLTVPPQGFPQLMKYDGTGEGPVTVEHPVPGRIWTGMSGLVPHGNSVWFHDYISQSLWRTDGTPAGTRPVAADPAAGALTAASDFLSAGPVLYFSGYTEPTGRKLWRTVNDGEGVEPVPGTGLGFAALRVLGEMEGSVYYSAYSPDAVLSIWRASSDARGAMVTERIFTGAYPDDDGRMTRAGNLLYFRIVEPGESSLPRLCRTDGTESGTFIIGKSKPETVEMQAFTPVAFGGSVCFMARRPSTSGIRELWSADGTESGFRLIKSFPNEVDGVRHVPFSDTIMPAGGLLYFIAGDALHGLELWRSDGTGDGTRMIVDIYPGMYGADIEMLGEMDGRLLFAATDDAHGRELWSTDGTVDGTAMVADTVPGLDSSLPASMVRIGDAVYYTVCDDGTGRPSVMAIWSGRSLAPLSIRQAPSAGVRLEWPALSPESLRLQYSADLSDGGWRDLPLPVTLEAGRKVVTDTAGGLLRFYRLARP